MFGDARVGWWLVGVGGGSDGGVELAAAHGVDGGEQVRGVTLAHADLDGWVGARRNWPRARWEIRLDRRYRRTRRVAASRGGCPPTADVKEADDKEGRLLTPAHLHFIAHRGACGKPRVVSYNRQPEPETYGNGRSKMRLLLSTHGSRGDVDPMVGLAVRLWALGAEMPVCAPPDFAEMLARVGIPLVLAAPVGQPVRPLVTGATPPSEADLPRRPTELVAAQVDTVATTAEGCDAPVPAMPAGEWL